MWIFVFVVSLAYAASNRKPFEVPSQRTVWTSTDDESTSFGEEDLDYESFLSKYAVIQTNSDSPTEKRGWKLNELWQSFTQQEKQQVMLGSVIILLGLYIFILEASR